jgi:hypothetical protein
VDIEQIRTGQQSTCGISMHVSVVEAGQGKRPVEINSLGAGPHQPADLRIRPHGEDPFTSDRHGLGPGLLFIKCVYLTIHQD